MISRMAVLAGPGLASLVAISVSLSLAHAAYVDEIPVTDQSMTLQCWSVAIASRLDVSASQKHKAPLKISPKYLLYAKTRAEVLELILKRKFVKYETVLCEHCEREMVYYEQGAVLLDGIEVARVHGVMPESAYGGFPKEDHKLFVALNQMIGRYQERLSGFDFKSPWVRESVEAEVDQELTRLLDKYLGHPPATFTFEGIRYTPKEFFDAYLSDWRDSPARELNYSPGAQDGAKKEKAYDGAVYEVLTTGNAKRLRAVISESLKAGEPVLLQYKAFDDYHTQAKGRIGFGAQGLPVVAPTLKLWRDTMTHYVLAIGGEWRTVVDEETGKPREELSRIRVKNTWGVSKSEGYGFHWMEEDYLPWLEAIEINEKLVPQLKKLRLM